MRTGEWMSTATYLWPSLTILLRLLPIVIMCILMNTLPITDTLKWAIYAKECEKIYSDVKALLLVEILLYL